MLLSEYITNVLLSVLLSDEIDRSGVLFSKLLHNKSVINVFEHEM